MCAEKVGAPLAIIGVMVKTQVMEIEQNLEIEVVCKEVLDPNAWDKASDAVADCLLILLRIEAEHGYLSDKGQKNGFD